MIAAAYYNEIDPFAAQWLRNLITAGFIAPGDVDERDIRDVCPDDLKPYTQCHFFAGIGVWSHALRRAGWSDDRPVWTGSCPCQPFSSAGRRGGVADERHLWPHWFHLIAECRPSVVFGEQVASKDGRAWFDLVQADLEGLDYAAGAFDLCAAGFGAPHIRQRLYFTATQGVDDAASARHVGPLEGSESDPRDETRVRLSDIGRSTDRLADDVMSERPRAERKPRLDHEEPGRLESAAAASGHGDTHRPLPTNGFWRDADWLGCRDGKWRPVEPGAFPLVNGASSRVGRLRAYGNAIVAPQAEAFISAFMESVQ